MSTNSSIHIIAGPTASGKSAKAIELAQALNGVIINCDSMQLYDDLPILSAQPSAQDAQNVPHLLYAILHPNDVCSAGNYREMVEPVIEEVLQNGQIPIICGGTGLYIKSIMDGLSPVPDIPQEVRDAAVAMQKKLGNPGFHKALQKRDPIMAERFHAHHTARLIRAWEVLDATGKSLAEWQEEPRIPPPSHWTFEVHKIMPERETLRDRCDERFLWMVENGALEEVEAFQSRIESGEVRDDVPLTKALGFKNLRDYIQGKLSRDEAIEKSQAETRQYAKRQSTWFRNQL
jgi:tRNA dimethylallyltransferase